MVGQGHSEEDLCTDRNLMRWAGRMKALLVFLARSLGVRDEWALFELVHKNRLYPEGNDELSGLHSLYYRMYDLILDHDTIEDYQISPPNTISTLLHWSVLARIIHHAGEPCQRHVLELDEEVSLVWPAHLQTIDAHAHLDKIVDQDYVSVHGAEAACPPEEHIDLEFIVVSMSFRNSMINYRTLHLGRRLVFTFGFHPHETSEKLPEEEWEALCNLMESPKCVGIGEVGLDYLKHPAQEERERQRAAFARSIQVAQRKSKPLVLHCRDALDDCLQIIRQQFQRAGPLPLYVHCFTGGMSEVAKWQAVAPEVLFGFGKNLLSSQDKPEVISMVRELDLRSFLLESDAPYQLTSPWSLKPVVKMVAAIRNLAPTMICEQARLNARRFYRL